MKPYEEMTEDELVQAMVDLDKELEAVRQRKLECKRCLSILQMKVYDAHKHLGTTVLTPRLVPTK